MKTLIDKINAFESAPVSSVAKFNEIFTSTPLTGLNPELEVEIGELADTDTTRWLTVGSLVIKHNFTPLKITEVNEDGSDLSHSDSKGGFYKESKWGKV